MPGGRHSRDLMAKPSTHLRLALLAAVASLGLAAAHAAAAQSGAAPAKLESASVRPARAFFEARGVRISFALRGAQPTDVSVRLVTGGRVVDRFLIDAARPGETHVRVWRGRLGSGKPGPEGRYRVSLKPKGGAPLRLGAFSFHHDFFPVRGRHRARGYLGEFGAPRSGGRRHEGFDILAACGTRLVAARGGRVVRRGYDPVLYGNYVLIHAAASRRTLFYAHMVRPASVARGERVRTGQTVGRIGRTGNARTTPCHLHFEIRVHGRPVDPEPYLRRWDRFS